jgi:hypothetical protein
VETATPEEDEELKLFLELEKEVLREEFKKQGIYAVDKYDRRLSNLEGKAEQNMENMVRNQILNMQDSKVSQTLGDSEEVFYNEENIENIENEEDVNYYKRS